VNRLLAACRDWVFTGPFLVAFGLVLLVFDLLQRPARALGRRPHEIVVNLLQKSLTASLRLCGTRLVVERAGGLAAGRPAIFVSNHQSMFDIPILGAILWPHYLKFVSKRELVRRWIPSISYNLRRGGNALIDRGDRAEAVAAIGRLGQEEVAGRGVSAVIFPEGTRARDGVLRPFRPQGTFALMAAAPDAPVVPVVIDGSWRLLKDGLRPVPFGTRVRVFIGAPIERSPNEDGGAVVMEAQAQIRSALARWCEASGDESD
jgi:1-acyl-sn-glycerol-3-phosphate acyltransferase